MKLFDQIKGLFRSKPVPPFKRDGDGYTFTQASPCPGCKANLKFGMVESGADRPPEENDQGVCMHCGMIIEWHNNELIALREESWAALPVVEQQALLSMQAHATRFKHYKPVVKPLEQELAEVFGED